MRLDEIRERADKAHWFDKEAARVIQLSVVDVPFLLELVSHAEKIISKYRRLFPEMPTCDSAELDDWLRKVNS